MVSYIESSVCFEQNQSFMRDACYIPCNWSLSRSNIVIFVEEIIITSDHCQPYIVDPGIPVQLFRIAGPNLSLGDKGRFAVRAGLSPRKLLISLLNFRARLRLRESISIGLRVFCGILTSIMGKSD